MSNSSGINEGWSDSVRTSHSSRNLDNYLLWPNQRISGPLDQRGKSEVQSYKRMVKPVSGHWGLDGAKETTHKVKSVSNLGTWLRVGGCGPRTKRRSETEGWKETLRPTLKDETTVEDRTSGDTDLTGGPWHDLKLITVDLKKVLTRDDRLFWLRL